MVGVKIEVVRIRFGVGVYIAVKVGTELGLELQMGSLFGLG